jgi:hypothetical protein
MINYLANRSGSIYAGGRATQEAKAERVGEREANTSLINKNSSNPPPIPE